MKINLGETAEQGVQKKKQIVDLRSSPSQEDFHLLTKNHYCDTLPSGQFKG